MGSSGNGKGTLRDWLGREEKRMGWEGYIRRLGGLGREGNRKATSRDWVGWEGKGWEGYIMRLGGAGS